MPKAPRPPGGTQPRKEDPPKKRVYTVIEEGVPEAAAFLVLVKNFTVAHAARILNAKRKALSKHVQKFRENRALLLAPRRITDTLGNGNVSSVTTSAVQAPAVVNIDAEMTSALVSSSAAAVEIAAPGSVAETGVVLENQFPGVGQVAGAAAQSYAEAVASVVNVAPAVPELAVAQDSAEASGLAMEVQSSFTEQEVAAAAASTSINALENKLPVVGEAVVTESSAGLDAAVADCTCCARCQEWKRLQK
ncbi:hypothetical protein Gpo141_00004136 [Globisporangium polare]